VLRFTAFTIHQPESQRRVVRIGADVRSIAYERSSYACSRIRVSDGELARLQARSLVAGCRSNPSPTLAGTVMSYLVKPMRDQITKVVFKGLELYRWHCSRHINGKCWRAVFPLTFFGNSDNPLSNYWGSMKMGIDLWFIFVST